MVFHKCFWMSLILEHKKANGIFEELSNLYLIVLLIISFFSLEEINEIEEETEEVEEIIYLYKIMFDRVLNTYL